MRVVEKKIGIFIIVLALVLNPFVISQIFQKTQDFYFNLIMFILDLLFIFTAFLFYYKINIRLEKLNRIIKIITKKRVVIFLFFLILISGFLFRFAHIDDSMRGDESSTILDYVLLPIEESVSTYNSSNNHLFNTLMLEITIFLFGIENFALRIPVFIFGVCSIIMIFILTDKLFDKETALIASVLFAIYPISIFYSANARGYSFAIFFSILSVFLIYNGVLTKKRRYWIFGSLSAILSIYSIPIMAYLYISLTIWLFIVYFKEIKSFNFKRISDPLIFFIMTPLLTLVLYLPVLPEIIHVYTKVDQNLMPVGFSVLFSKEFLGRLVSNYIFPYVWNMPKEAEFFLFIFFIAGIICLANIKNHKNIFYLLFSIIFLPFFLSIVQRVTPLGRAFVYMLPFFCIVSAFGFVCFLRALSKECFSKKRYQSVAVYSILVLSIFLALSCGYVQYFNSSEFNHKNFENAESILLFLDKNVLIDEKVYGLQRWPEREISKFVIYQKDLINIKFAKNLEWVSSKDDYYAFYFVVMPHQSMKHLIESNNLTSFVSEPYLVFEKGENQIYYSKNLNLNISNHKKKLAWLYHKKE